MSDYDEPSNAVVIGVAGGRTFDFKAKVTSRSDREAYLVTDTEPQHRIGLVVRYQGSVIGGRPFTTCSFVFDDEYVALAQVEVTDDGRFVVTPEDY